jgi:hypothetical protein
MVKVTCPPDTFLLSPSRNLGRFGATLVSDASARCHPMVQPSHPVTTILRVVVLGVGAFAALGEAVAAAKANSATATTVRIFMGLPICRITAEKVFAPLSVDLSVTVTPRLGV